jgi:hypothetical protein
VQRKPIAGLVSRHVGVAYEPQMRAVSGCDKRLTQTTDAGFEATDTRVRVGSFEREDVELDALLNSQRRDEAPTRAVERANRNQSRIIWESANP